MYDAITRLRPGFFATRGVSSILNEPPNAIVVVVNRMVFGGVDALRDIDPKTVRIVRRLSSTDVFRMTGRPAPSGGIEIVYGP